MTTNKSPPPKPRHLKTKETLARTRERRQTQTAHVVRLKVFTNKLSPDTLEHLQRLFLEAKWFRNAIVGSNDVFQFDLKVKTIPVYVGGNVEYRPLTVLSSQMKQGILSQVKDDIKSLAEKKKNGYKVGKLKFKSQITSIPLKQFTKTYQLNIPTHIRIEKLKPWLRATGFDQFPETFECANAQLVQKPDGYYLHVILYIPKKDPRTIKKSVGADLGIANQLTLSNGIQILYEFPLPIRAQGLQKALARKERFSANWYRTQHELACVLQHWRNQKEDAINKLVHELSTNYDYICIQNDPINNWQRLWGTRILNTALGSLVQKLKRKTTHFCSVDRWTATTKRCSHCDTILSKALALVERTFICPNSSCGYTAPRDYNAAECIEKLGLIEYEMEHPLPLDLTLSSSVTLNSSPVERGSTPVETRVTTALLEKLNAIHGMTANYCL